MAVSADYGKHGLGFACIKPQYAIADICVRGMVPDTATGHAFRHLYRATECMLNTCKLRFDCATHERANDRI